MITIQNYVRARSLEEAWRLNQNKRSRIMGGMLWLRLGSGTAVSYTHLDVYKRQSIYYDATSMSSIFCKIKVFCSIALFSRDITRRMALLFHKGCVEKPFSLYFFESASELIYLFL